MIRLAPREEKKKEIKKKEATLAVHVKQV